MGRSSDALTAVPLQVDSHRRIRLSPSMLVIDRMTQRVTGPSSAAFRPRREEDGLSVYRDALLRQQGLGPDRVATAGGSPAVAAGLVDEVISGHGLAVTADPQATPADIGSSHALIVGWDGLSNAKSRELARNLASCAVCTHPPLAWGSLPAPTE